MVGSVYSILLKTASCIQSQEIWHNTCHICGKVILYPNSAILNLKLYRRYSTFQIRPKFLWTPHRTLITYIAIDTTILHLMILCTVYIVREHSQDQSTKCLVFTHFQNQYICTCNSLETFFKIQMIDFSNIEIIFNVVVSYINVSLEYCSWKKIVLMFRDIAISLSKIVRYVFHG